MILRFDYFFSFDFYFYFILKSLIRFAIGISVTITSYLFQIFSRIVCVSIFVLIKRENCQPINRKLMRLLTLLEFEAIIDKRRFQSGRKLPAIPF